MNIEQKDTLAYLYLQQFMAANPKPDLVYIRQSVEAAWKLADMYAKELEARKAEYERVCENGCSDGISDETNADTEIA